MLQAEGLLKHCLEAFRGGLMVHTAIEHLVWAHKHGPQEARGLAMAPCVCSCVCVCARACVRVRACAIERVYAKHFRAIQEKPPQAVAELAACRTCSMPEHVVLASCHALMLCPLMCDTRPRCAVGFFMGRTKHWQPWGCSRHYLFTHTHTQTQTHARTHTHTHTHTAVDTPARASWDDHSTSRTHMTPLTLVAQKIRLRHTRPTTLHETTTLPS